ncbi:MAG: OmpP1/FadL family transporter [Proteobacteria bacterium]|nr:OmpP1/FadL family transporter [Pseudomonadota bacterium]
MMKKEMRWVLLVLCIGTGIFCSRTALGAGFALYEGSARGNALGGSLVGRADDPSALFYNPAGITQLPGTQVMGGGTLIMPTSEVITNDSSGQDAKRTKSNWFFPPHGYMTHQYSDKLWFGVGIFCRFGLGTEFNDNWSGRHNSYNAFVKGIEINPNVAWKVTDKFSIAAGASLMRLDIKLQSKAALADVDTKLEGRSLGYGFNLALHYRPVRWMSVGFLYRSKVKHTAHGDAEFLHPNYLRRAFPDGRISADVTLPDEYFFGIAFRPFERLTVETDAIMTRWHNFKKMTIEFKDPVAGMDEVTKQKNWRDVWRYQIGIEYRLTEWVDARLGYVYDNEPIPGGTADYLVPADDRQLFSFGFGFHIQKVTADISYTYLLSKDRNIDKRQADGVLDGRIHDSICHLFGITIGYKF